MAIGKLYKCDVITAPHDALVSDVAKLMKQYNIGDIVVVDNKNSPLGIITDRDIAVKIVADEVDSKQVSAADIMSSDLLILKEYQDIQEAIDMMSAKNIRRAPIVDENNQLCGIVSVDDLIMQFAEGLQSIARIIYKQVAV